MVKRIEGLSVLVVDDNRVAMNLMTKMLEQFGIDQIYTAPDGRSALDLLVDGDERIDIVLCDWQMPEINGLELLEGVRLLLPDLYFIMVTGKRDIRFMQSATNSGADAFICKPFTPQQLEDKLQNFAHRGDKGR